MSDLIGQLAAASSIVETTTKGIRESIPESHMKIILDSRKAEPLPANLPCLKRLSKTLGNTGAGRVCRALSHLILGENPASWPTRTHRLIICVPQCEDSILVDRSILLSHAGLIRMDAESFLSFQGTVRPWVVVDGVIESISGIRVESEVNFKGGTILMMKGTLPSVVSVRKIDSKTSFDVFSGKILGAADGARLLGCITTHAPNETPSPWKRVNPNTWKFSFSKPLHAHTRIFFHIYDVDLKMCTASHELGVRYVPQPDCITGNKRKRKQKESQRTLKASLYAILCRLREAQVIMCDLNSVSLESKIGYVKSIFDARLNGYAIVHYLATVEGTEGILSIILHRFRDYCGFRTIDDDYCSPLMLAMRYDNKANVALLAYANEGSQMDWKKVWGACGGGN